MRRVRRRVPPTPMVAVTSMMDMFTIILVFLLNFLDPAASPSDDLQLPASTTDAPATEGRTLTVGPKGIQVEGDVLIPLVAGVGGLALPEGTSREGRTIVPLYERLSALAPIEAAPSSEGGPEKTASDAALRIECDRGVPFSLLGDVLFTAGQAGFDQFRFVVIDEAG